ncbi:MAG TPA: ABC transporter permease subunit [Candidatus Azoamicus sp. OHIO2]
MKNIYKIIKKEFHHNIKNYWIILSAFIISAVNLLIIYFGEIISGDYSQTDIKSLVLSLIHLQMYLIPLLSFMLSYDSILAERESGMLDLILSYRISLLEIFLGKLCGNSLIFALAFLLGFIPVGIYLTTLGINIFMLLKFYIISIWLSIIFNAFALYISDSSKDRTIVILLSILIWLFFIIIYDILFILLTILFYGKLSLTFLNLLLLLNPTEIFKLLSILCFMPDAITDLFGMKIIFLSIYHITILTFSWLIIILYIFFFICLKKK